MQRKISYRGKEVFIGIDVHKRTYFFTALCDGEVVKGCSVKADPYTLVKVVDKLFKGAEILTAYEAGFSSFVLHRVLISEGMRNIVVHPASVEEESRNRVKTDKRDSKKLAEQLAAGRPKGINVPSPELEHRRLLTRTREQLTRQRRRLMVQIRMKFHQFGLMDPDCRQVLRRAMVHEILKEEIPQPLRLSVTVLLRLWDGVDKELKTLQRELKEEAKQDPRQKTYRSIPGFGFLSAWTLSNELGDMSQFPNERTLFSFTGLTPSEHSTGDSRRRGHISRQGSSRLRHILVEAAWVAIRRDAGLARDFSRISLRAGKKRAIVAIARKLVGRARALFRKNQLYQFQVRNVG